MFDKTGSSPLKKNVITHSNFSINYLTSIIFLNKNTMKTCSTLMKDYCPDLLTDWLFSVTWHSILLFYSTFLIGIIPK